MSKRNASLCLCENSVSLWWKFVGRYSPQRHRVPLRHREILLAIVLSFFSMTAAPALVAQVAQPIEDPAIEARMKNLTKQLRCLVCQNETLADSQAQLAEDLRR